MSLNHQEQQQFHQLGYVVKSGVYNQEDIQPIANALTEMTDNKARELHAQGKLEDVCADAPFETRLGQIYKINPRAAEIIIASIMGKGGGGYSGPAMLHALRHPPLLSCIESLIGPDIIGSSVYRIRPKLPSWERGAVPWHQDSGYFLAHCDTHLIVTCWIPLIDATVDNGCLHVIPGAHRNGILRHYTGGHAGYLEVPGDELPQADPIPVPMRAGDVLFMTNLTPHASFDNNTDQVRWSLDLRYQGMDAPNNIGEDPKSYTMEREPTTMACYPPEADFVIQDTQHPQQEVRTAEAFYELRERYERARPYSPGRGWTPLRERA